MLVSLLPAFDAFEFLANGRSEAYRPGVVSEGTRTIGPRLANSGRKVAMEAAMIPRFISSLCLFQLRLHEGMHGKVLTWRTWRWVNCHLE